MIRVKRGPGRPRLSASQQNIRAFIAGLPSQNPLILQNVKNPASGPKKLRIISLRQSPEPPPEPPKPRYVFPSGSESESESEPEYQCGPPAPISEEMRQLNLEKRELLPDEFKGILTEGDPNYNPQYFHSFYRILANIDFPRLLINRDCYEELSGYNNYRMTPDEEDPLMHRLGPEILNGPGVAVTDLPVIARLRARRTGLVTRGRARRWQQELDKELEEYVKELLKEVTGQMIADVAKEVIAVVTAERAALKAANERAIMAESAAAEATTAVAVAGAQTAAESATVNTAATNNVESAAAGPAAITLATAAQAAGEAAAAGAGTESGATALAAIGPVPGEAAAVQPTAAQPTNRRVHRAPRRTSTIVTRSQTRRKLQKTTDLIARVAMKLAGVQFARMRNTANGDVGRAARGRVRKIKDSISCICKFWKITRGNRWRFYRCGGWSVRKSKSCKVSNYASWKGCRGAQCRSGKGELGPSCNRNRNVGAEAKRRVSEGASPKGSVGTGKVSTLSRGVPVRVSKGELIRVTKGGMLRVGNDQRMRTSRLGAVRVNKGEKVKLSKSGNVQASKGLKKDEGRSMRVDERDKLQRVKKFYGKSQGRCMIRGCMSCKYNKGGSCMWQLSKSVKLKEGQQRKRVASNSIHWRGPCWKVNLAVRRRQGWRKLGSLNDSTGGCWRVYRRTVRCQQWRGLVGQHKWHMRKLQIHLRSWMKTSQRRRHQ